MKKKDKPQIGKREAQQLAARALTDPLGVLTEIAQREKNATATINLGWSCNTDCLLWVCSLSFAGAMYAAKGASEVHAEAVKVAILRAYDTGSEKGW